MLGFCTKTPMSDCASLWAGVSCSCTYGSSADCVGWSKLYVNICVVWVCILISEQNTMLLIWVEFCNSNTSHVKKKNDKKKLINYVYQQWWIFEFKASLTERLRVPWKRRVVWAMCSFPKCITYISQAYSPSVSVIEPWKYFHFAVRSARAFAIHR